MSKTPSPQIRKKSRPSGVQINMLLTVEEVEELQREVRRRQEENPGVRLSNAVVARDLVLRALRGDQIAESGRGKARVTRVKARSRTGGRSASTAA